MVQKHHYIFRKTFHMEWGTTSFCCCWSPLLQLRGANMRWKKMLRRWSWY